MPIIDQESRNLLLAAFDGASCNPIATVKGVTPGACVFMLYFNELPAFAGQRAVSINEAIIDTQAKLTRNHYNLAEFSIRWLVVTDTGHRTALLETILKRDNPKFQRSGFGDHVKGAGRPGVEIPEWK